MIAYYVACIDVFHLKLVDNLMAAIINANPPHERDTKRPQAGGGNGLIGSFAAGKDQKVFAAHCFPWRRNHRPAHNVVGIGSSNHDDIPFW